MADLRERPAGLDPDVYVDTSSPRGLREARVAELVQEHACLGGDSHGVFEVCPRLRVEVDAQLVRMVDVVAANGPRVKRDRAHLSGPTDDRYLGGTDLIRVATRRELDPRGLHVVRRSLWNALLVEGVAAALLTRRDDDPRMHALRPALERRRPPLDRAHDAVTNGKVVLDDVELGDRACALGLGEDHAIGAGHAQIAPAGVDDHRVGCGHARSSTAPARPERPASRGWA